MKWEVVKLADIADVFSGYAFKSSDMLTSEGVPLIKIKNINNRIVSAECDSYLNPAIITSKYDKYIMQDDDFLVAMTGQGSVGRIGKMPTILEKYYINQRVGIVRVDSRKAIPHFIFLQMADDTTEQILFNKANGAGQPNLSPAQIGEVEIVLPPKVVQKRITDILSAYDDLIENNQKQIKLLEEAAMRLYKEWFVNLRFPGYENSKIVDGVPEGWRLGRVSELAEFKRGKTITKKNAKDGNVPVVAGGLEPAYFHNVANTVAPVITISASGANAGYTRLYNTDIWASDCSYIDASYGDKLYFIYTFLKNNKEVIDNLQRGAAQPHVYAKDINALSTYIPESTIMEPFCNLVAPLFKKIAVQERLISELKQARDKLLPKLMSGEIEV